MDLNKLALAVGLAVVATGAVAETGVGIPEINHVANIYGRAGVPTVRITGKLVTPQTDANVVGRNPASGVTTREDVVQTKPAGADTVFGRA
ncbi:MAG TPA: hypothetical protein VFB20_08975 [Burkholderiales bacterium]|nr:hypothetical protein [Burkholderiales bacterium]